MKPFARAPGEGEALWFLGNLVDIKATAEQTGGLAVVEIKAPQGFLAAPHVHDRDEEAFYILEGTLRVSCGDVSQDAKPGSFVYMPKGVPHSVGVVGDEPARWLLLQTPTGDFTSSAREIGKPATSRGFPSATEPAPDPASVLAAMTKYHIRPVPAEDRQ